MVLGIVMGTMVEQAFVTSLIKSDGSILPFFERPISAILAAMTIAALPWPVVVWMKRKLTPRAVWPPASRVRPGGEPPRGLYRPEFAIAYPPDMLPSPSPRKLRAGRPRGAGARDHAGRERRADHQATARDLVQALLPETGKALRVGITGVPGVGKSTTIDALGTF